MSNRFLRPQAFAFVPSFATLLLIWGCSPPPPPGPNAVINAAIVSSGVDGSADDAFDNDGNLPDRYLGPAKLVATDGTTNASSVLPLFNKLSGVVHAESGKIGGATRDEAIAVSNNKVITTLTVTKGDSFTFNINLDVQGPNIQGHGKLTIDVSAFVLDAQGHTVKDATGKDLPPIFMGKFGGAPNAAGKLEITPPGGGGPDPLDANGNYVRDLKGPNGGLPLPKGNYQLKLELNLQAKALAGPNIAEVKSASATITLR